MNRDELEAYIREEYAVEGDFPWGEYPDFEVFRHRSNRKWFALLGTVSRDKLGLAEPGETGIVNLKCDPVLIGSLRHETGFFPAYHMNKEKWISVALDGSAPDDTIKMLLEMSFEATREKKHKKSGK